MPSEDKGSQVGKQRKFVKHGEREGERVRVWGWKGEEPMCCGRQTMWEGH